MSEHGHKFQFEGDTWACFGWEGACGLRAPACFTPKPEACTPKGLNDLAYMAAGEKFIAEHFVIVSVK